MFFCFFVLGLFRFEILLAVGVPSGLSADRSNQRMPEQQAPRRACHVDLTCVRTCRTHRMRLSVCTGRSCPSRA